MFVISVVPLSKLAEVLQEILVRNMIKLSALSLSVQHEDHGAPRVWSGRPGNGPSLRPLRVEKQFIFSDQVEPHPAQSLLNILALSHLSSHI